MVAAYFIYSEKNENFNKCIGVPDSRMIHPDTLGKCRPKDEGEVIGKAVFPKKIADPYRRGHHQLAETINGGLQISMVRGIRGRTVHVGKRKYSSGITGT